jgi:hypothetical protein
MVIIYRMDPKYIQGGSKIFETGATTSTAVVVAGIAGRWYKYEV